MESERELKLDLQHAIYKTPAQEAEWQSDPFADWTLHPGDQMTSPCDGDPTEVSGPTKILYGKASRWPGGLYQFHPDDTVYQYSSALVRMRTVSSTAYQMEIHLGERYGTKNYPVLIAFQPKERKVSKKPRVKRPSIIVGVGPQSAMPGTAESMPLSDQDSSGSDVSIMSQLTDVPLPHEGDLGSGSLHHAEKQGFFGAHEALSDTSSISSTSSRNSSDTEVQQGAERNTPDDALFKPNPSRIRVGSHLRQFNVRTSGDSAQSHFAQPADKPLSARRPASASTSMRRSFRSPLTRRVKESPNNSPRESLSSASIAVSSVSFNAQRPVTSNQRSRPASAVMRRGLDGSYQKRPPISSLQLSDASLDLIRTMSFSNGKAVIDAIHAHHSGYGFHEVISKVLDVIIQEHRDAALTSLLKAIGSRCALSVSELDKFPCRHQEVIVRELSKHFKNSFEHLFESFLASFVNSSDARYFKRPPFIKLRKTLLRNASPEQLMRYLMLGIKRHLFNTLRPHEFQTEVDFLVNQGLIITQLTLKMHRSVLHYAAMYSTVEIFSVLIEKVRSATEGRNVYDIVPMKSEGMLVERSAFEQLLNMSDSKGRTVLNLIERRRHGNVFYNALREKFYAKSTAHQSERLQSAVEKYNTTSSNAQVRMFAPRLHDCRGSSFKNSFRMSGQIPA